MNTENLEKSPIKDKYFARTEKWDWLTKKDIHIFDSKSPRVITMDPWPQMIYLDALGDKTVKDYIYNLAKKYPKTQVPKELADTVLSLLSELVDEEKIIQLSDYPIAIDESIKNPMTEEGKINLIGTWKGSYSYSIPSGYQKIEVVEFTIKIDKVEGANFFGTVEDNQENGGTPGIGKIVGTFTAEEIQFDKDMPVSTKIYENGEHVTDSTKKHPTIRYKGVFSRSKQQITGTWLFKKKKIFWLVVIPIWYSGGNGSFTMQKEDN